MASFATYLNRYTTVSADHEAAFDEYLAEVPPPPGGPLALKTMVESFVKERFQQPRPPSIILTGNAGDGKTYLSRRVIETFVGKFDGWGEAPTRSISRGNLTLKVVKDLSELDERSGKEKLFELASEFSNPASETVFLISANEGRLRKLLNDETLAPLRNEVDSQLLNGANAEADVVVINLNETTTSTFVPQVLSWLTSETNWPEMEVNSTASCPISFNVSRLRDPFVQERITLLYRVLEHLGIHITIRDMLIHLAFTVTAGHQKSDFENMPIEEKARFAYYNNVIGLNANPVFRQRSNVLNQLSRLKLGDYSGFELDNFILNGHEAPHTHFADHERLFFPALDLGHRRFQQERDAYHFGTTMQEGEEEVHFLSWLPHLRRKLFFEWSHTAYTNKLFLFSTTAEYFDLFNGDDLSKCDRYLHELVLGLNRAFSNLYLTDDQTLFLTMQYEQSGEMQVPVVKLRMPVSTSLELIVKPQPLEVVNRDSFRLVIRVFPPRQVDEDILEWPIDLMLFEYLLRRARGGTPNILAPECELHIRRMKDDLTKNIALKYRNPDKVEFLAADPKGYKLTTLYLTNDGKLRVTGNR